MAILRVLERIRAPVAVKIVDVATDLGFRRPHTRRRFVPDLQLVNPLGALAFRCGQWGTGPSRIGGEVHTLG